MFIDKYEFFMDDPEAYLQEALMDEIDPEEPNALPILVLAERLMGAHLEAGWGFSEWAVAKCVAAAKSEWMV